MERVLKSIIGWLLASFGLMALAIEIDHILQGTSEDMVLAFVLSGLFMAGGGALILSARRTLMKRGS